MHARQQRRAAEARPEDEPEGAGVYVADGAAVRAVVREGDGDRPTAVKVVTGEKYGCVLGTDAKITCWGDGTIIERPMTCHGDVCDRPTIDRSPRKAPLAHVIDISTARGDLCARTSDSKVRCIARTSVTSLSETTPVAQDHAWTSPPDYTQVVKGRDHTCGLRANGLVRCWGDNTFGQLGTGVMGLVPAPAH